MVGNPEKAESETPPGINICVGGYDGSVAGLSLKTDTDDLLSLSANFAYASHIGAVRSAAFNGPTLVTGSVDETIHIYDLARRVERGSLFEHNGTINSLKFFQDGPRDLLLSAGDDAIMCVWRASDWRCLKKLHGHQSPILDVAVHPSARVALSVAKDRSLFMWNMVKGKIAFSAKTKGCPATNVEWSPSGDSYLLVAGKTVKLSTVEGRAVSSFVHEREVLSSTFISEETVATGGEEKVVRLWDSRTPAKSVMACQHNARIRGLAFVDSLLISGDSTGGMKIWDVRVGDRPRLETNVGGGDMRLTCLSAASELKKVAPAETVDAEEESEGKQQSKRRRGTGKNESHRRRDTEPSVPLEGTASQRKRKKRNKGKDS